MLGFILAFTAVMIFIIGAIENDFQHQKHPDVPMSLSEICLHRRHVPSLFEDAKEDPSPSYREGLKTLAWPCNCSSCSFIEREYLADTNWPEDHRLPHDCRCEYTIRGRNSEYVAKYPCDADWFRRRYCILPIPRSTSYGYFRPEDVKGVPGKTRLGRVVAHGSRCESGYACNAMLHYSWIDDVFNCEG